MSSNFNNQGKKQRHDIIGYTIISAIGIVLLTATNGLIVNARIHEKGSAEVATVLGATVIGVFAACVGIIIALWVAKLRIWPAQISKKKIIVLCCISFWLVYLLIAEFCFRSAPKTNLTEVRTGDIIVTTAAPNYRWESPVTAGGGGFMLLLGINAFQIVVLIAPLLAWPWLLFTPTQLAKFFED
jgi:hypothetical protein